MLYVYSFLIFVIVATCASAALCLTATFILDNLPRRPRLSNRVYGYLYNGLVLVGIGVGVFVTKLYVDA